MLINLDTKEVFIHIPRTGGLSITCTLKWKLIKGFLDGHTSIDQFKEKNTNEYKFYTFVRNPYTRFESLYNFCIIHGYINDSPLTFATNIFLGKYDWNFTNPMCFFCRKTQLEDFGRLETFDEDFKRMFKCDYQPKKINQLKNVNIYEKFTQLRDIVARLYYEDFIEFGYDIQPFMYKNIPVTWNIEDLTEIKTHDEGSYVQSGSVHDKLPLIFIPNR
jgi:hypothetical protein